MLKLLFVDSMSSILLYFIINDGSMELTHPEKQDFEALIQDLPADFK